MKKIKPINNKILVRRKKPETKTKGGIFIPETATKKDAVDGEVVALPCEVEVLPGRLLEIGELVIFKRYAGTDLKLDDEYEYTMLDPLDLLAVYDKEKRKAKKEAKV